MCKNLRTPYDSITNGFAVKSNNLMSLFYSWWYWSLSSKFCFILFRSAASVHWDLWAFAYTKLFISSKTFHSGWVVDFDWTIMIPPIVFTTITVLHDNSSAKLYISGMLTQITLSCLLQVPRCGCITRPNITSSTTVLGSWFWGFMKYQWHAWVKISEILYNHTLPKLIWSP